MTSSNQPDSADSQKESDYAQAWNLTRQLPALGEAFSLHCKVGAGTFSSVWLASLRREENLPACQRRWFAIKHLVATVHPTRVEQELRCLRELGGRDNIIGVELCLRHRDTVVFVMPYIPHNKFSEYVLHMDAEETKMYMRALLLALSRVHSHGIIHRDVKPSNFLYDRTNRRFLLVDFGLAQRVGLRQDGDRVMIPPSDDVAHAPRPKRTCVGVGRGGRGGRSGGGTPLQHLQLDHPKLTVVPTLRERGGCRCGSRGVVCARCLARPAARAPRAGTQGFRPPEVLLKYPQQTTAVDVWACGVMLLSVLSGRYPFFRAGDDASALAELLSLFGSAPLQRAAAALGRQLVCSDRRRALCLRVLCARLRSRALASPSGPAPAPASPACSNCHLSRRECVCVRERDTRNSEDAVWCGFPDAAFDLLGRLLALEPGARLSAAAALQHPFLQPSPPL